MILTLDIGNTRAKAAVFDDNELVDHISWVNEDVKHLKDLIAQYDITACAYANVGKERICIEEYLNAIGLPYIRVTGNTKSGLNNPFPTLGADRLAADVGAKSKYPKGDLLVVDVGTCITYDLITEEGTIVGGNISPGLQLRLKSMNDYTALLPLVPIEGERPLMGYDTPTALRSGVIYGVIFEIKGYVDLLRKKHEGLTLVLTGNHVEEIAAHVTETLNIEEHLVDFGLLELAKQHIKGIDI